MLIKPSPCLPETDSSEVCEPVEVSTVALRTYADVHPLDWNDTQSKALSTSRKPGS